MKSTPLRVGFGLLFHPRSPLAVSGYTSYTSRLMAAFGSLDEIELVPWVEAPPSRLGPFSSQGLVRAAHRVMGRVPFRMRPRAPEREYAPPGAKWSSAAESRIVSMVSRLRDLKLDVFHITDWGAVGVEIFEACRRAGLPYVVSAVDYKPICAQSQLLRLGRENCSGPESSPKCAACLQGLGRSVTPLWISERNEAVNAHLANANALIAFTPAHIAELRRWLTIEESIYRVVPFAVPSPDPSFAKDPSAYKHPLEFVYVARACREWGLDQLLAAWRAAAPSVDQARLVVYTDEAFYRDGYADVVADELATGSVVARIGRVHDRLDEVHRSSAAIVVPSAWRNTGSSGALEAQVRATPVITVARYGVYDDLPNSMRRLAFDADNPVASLASKIVDLVLDPMVLSRAAGEHFSRPFGDHAAALVRIYEEASGRGVGA